MTQHAPVTGRRLPSVALADAGLVLPPVAKPIAAYTPAAVLDGLTPSPGDLYVVATSGQLSFHEGELAATGHVGTDADWSGPVVDPDTAYQCARYSALGAIAAAAQVAGGVDNLLAVTRVTAFVASQPTFTGQAAVANGASELFGDVFGTPGVDPEGRPYPTAHVRSAVGVAVLPLNAPVEVEAQFLALAPQ